jgi:hypothetical protein
MAGKGDFVRYFRTTAATKKEREELRKEINDFLDTVTRKITLITLIAKEADDDYEGQGTARGKKPRSSKRR